MAEEESSTIEADRLQRAVQQLYEDERLTGNLTDQAAQRLLGWGEQQLQALAGVETEAADFDRAAHQLQQVIRTINRLAGRQADLTETELVESLLDLVEQTIQIHKPTLATEQVTTDDQEAQEFPQEKQ